MIFAAPSGQPPPQVNETTPFSISLGWGPPLEPNGVISSYSVLQRAPSLSPSPLRRDVGVAFDGNIIKRFSSEDHALGGIANMITLSFRTFSRRGTILYYINEAGTDYIAIELRNGVPWFFFDAGSGPAVIRPLLAAADTVFNDGEWHSVTATQSSRTGTITIDGIHSGSGESSGTDQVISSRQTLHVGGIPGGLPRSTLLGLQLDNSTLEGSNFAGCLFGLVLNGQFVDFSDSTQVGESVIDNNIPGCSLQLEPGLSFLGGGYLSFPSSTLHSASFSWSFDIRSTHSEGLVFFVHDGVQSAIAVEVQQSLVYLIVLSNGVSQRRAGGGNAVCDGEWHTILIDQSLDEVFISVDGSGESLFLRSINTVFSSGVFFGGVPMGTLGYSIAQSAGVNLAAPFSGCVRPRVSEVVVGGVPVSIPSPTSHYLVRFDGCHSSTFFNSSASCGDPWVSLPAATSTNLLDTGLQPWSGT